MTEQAYPDALPAHHRMHWYTLERVLGQGGFGITYLARDTNLDQAVAIKEYLPVEVAARRADLTVQSRGESQRERYRWGLDRFIQEARTLARFDHPNIVRVHSVFEFNGTAYMVMRFEEGENLGTILDRRGTVPEGELLRILLPILDGLELVHNAGFIHRDIKPDNIHIRTDGTPVLLDFGSARHALGRARTLTILVAPGYAPFEQYSGNSENQGPWTDIYGLGATCYRAIAGTPPLDAIARSKGVLGSTREILAPAARIGSGRYSGNLLAAIDHALAFAEKGRPQSIEAWRREILELPAAVAVPPVTLPDAAVVTAAPLVAAAPMQPEAAAARTGSVGNIENVRSSARDLRMGSRSNLLWAAGGAAAGALALGLFLYAGSADRAGTQQLAEARRQLEAAQARLDAERAREVAARKQAVEEQARRQPDEADKARLAREVAQAEEAARKRLAEEAERKRLAEETARRQQAEERARKQQAEEAARARLAEEAARRQQAADAARKRQADADRARAIEVARQEAEQRQAAARQAAVQAGPRPATQPDVPSEQPEQVTSADAAPQPATAQSAASRNTGQAAAGEQLALADAAEARGDFGGVIAAVRPLADRGNPTAQAKLGELYKKGRGVPQNFNQAYVWYRLAARAGDAAASAGSTRAAARLQPAEIRQLDRLVERWRPRQSAP